MKKTVSATITKLGKLAKTARDKAYCPYSDYPVGAALVTKTGRIFTGANVEIANYKGICAEGSAISAMASAGERSIRDIVVIGPGMEHLCSPCGDCRQRIREFADEETRITVLWGDGSMAGIYAMDELLPDSFGPENLHDAKKKKPKTKTKIKKK